MVVRPKATFAGQHRDIGDHHAARQFDFYETQERIPPQRPPVEDANSAGHGDVSSGGTACSAWAGAMLAN
jgi:hypothetical protein